MNFAGDPLFNNESLSLVESMVNRTNGRIVADQIRDDSVGPIFETLSESLKSQVGSVVVAVDADETIAISVTYACLSFLVISYLRFCSLLSGISV